MATKMAIPFSLQGIMWGPLSESDCSSFNKTACNSQKPMSVPMGKLRVKRILYTKLGKCSTNSANLTKSKAPK